MHKVIIVMLFHLLLLVLGIGAIVRFQLPILCLPVLIIVLGIMGCFWLPTFKRWEKA